MKEGQFFFIVTQKKLDTNFLLCLVDVHFSLIITTNVVSSNPAQARCTRYNIMGKSLSMTCSRSVVFSRYSGFLHQWNWLPRYRWNFVESGNEHHKPNQINLIKIILWIHLHSWITIFVIQGGKKICGCVNFFWPPAIVSTYIKYMVTNICWILNYVVWYYSWNLQKFGMQPNYTACTVC